MTTDASRPLRADAARNFERILRAAREVFAVSGPDASLDEIARHAGVGIATLYRRFPDREVLVRAALDQGLAELVAPAVERALGDEDPRRGLITYLDAAMSMAARERNTLAAAKSAGAIAAEVSEQFFESLTLLARRGQQAGLIRADLLPEDLPRIMAMLVAVLWTMEPGSDGWQRYVALVLDSLSPAAANPLPPAVALWPLRKPGYWPVPSDE
ncbi:TetR/AcrR family transcriptional regulator [Streptomyces sp. NPDC059092]|uniref:TetR/AcrR family transcriptional regulator n=1 Tax=Streptomyces sp. NPDC059092 TaxID=3346725 RepID=UPI00368F902C